jgi:adenosylcobinamide-GDP ribazoletransferase
LPTSVIIVVMSGHDPSQRHRGFWAGFAAVTAFFTRVPTEPPARAAWQIADAAWAFPIVGAGIGAVTALTFLLAQLVGLGDWPTAALSVLAGVALTGALHEDGLADTADGVFGGRDREARLTIMADSRHGTFGVLAIVLSVLLRTAALASIGDMIHAGLALVAAHAASRAALPAVMSALASARPEGLGAAAGKPGLPTAAGSAVIGIVIAIAALGPALGAIALGITGGMVFAAASLARRRIGGYTGDILGAIQQIGEIVMLLAASIR